MSVIGTTLKQPRVFAHDAVALKDLPGCTWRGASDAILIDPGSGFLGGRFLTSLSTPVTTSNAGNGLIIETANVSDTGEIVDFDITPCSYGNAYNIGDEVSINPQTIVHSTGVQNSGSGYPPFVPPTTIPTSGGSGTGMTVWYTDNGAGQITDVLIISYGSGYKDGDIITIDAGNNDATFSLAESKPAVFEINKLIYTDWAYGCPFTSAYMGLQSLKIEDKSAGADIGKSLYGDATDPLPGRENLLGEQNVNGNLGKIDQLSGFLKKTLYTYSCDCEEGSEACACTYETPGPGAALYIGAAMTSLTVIMESGNKVTYTNVPAGSFMPILCLTVCAAVPEDEAVDPREVILALF